MLQLLKSEVGRKIISFVIGLGLAALFRKVCKDGNCVIVHGPPLEEVENKVFKMDSKCYRYKAESTTCEKGKGIVNEKGKGNTVSTSAK